jgi:RimJ/RimL family protein N-acetyltransferase
MSDPLRDEMVTLRDGRHVHVRPGRSGDEEALLENVNLVCAEDVYLMMDEVPWDLEREREWLGKFDGEENVLFVAADGRTIVGQADCHRGGWPKIAHTGTLGIAIRAGWREVGLGRVLMDRILDWMTFRRFEKACLTVFATNARARRLYESLGFEEEGIRRRQLKIRGEYVDEIEMGLWLARGP